MVAVLYLHVSYAEFSCQVTRIGIDFRARYYRHYFAIDMTRLILLNDLAEDTCLVERPLNVSQFHDERHLN